MKTMRGTIKENILENVSRMIGEQAKGLADEGVLNCTFIFFDEPEMPRELLEYKKTINQC